MTEIHLQNLCEEYLKRSNIVYFHVPDIAYKTKSVKAGIPDFLIFKDAWDHYPRCLLIELKTKTGKLSQGQKNLPGELQFM